MEDLGEPPDEQQGMQGLEEEGMEEDLADGGGGQADLEDHPAGEDELEEPADANPAKRARNVRMLDSDDEED